MLPQLGNLYISNGDSDEDNDSIESRDFFIIDKDLKLNNLINCLDQINNYIEEGESYSHFKIIFMEFDLNNEDTKMLWQFIWKCKNEIEKDHKGWSFNIIANGKKYTNINNWE